MAGVILVRCAPKKGTSTTTLSVHTAQERMAMVEESTNAQCTRMLVRMAPVKIWTWATDVSVLPVIKWIRQEKLASISTNAHLISRSVMVASVEIPPEVTPAFVQ